MRKKTAAIYLKVNSNDQNYENHKTELVNHARAEGFKVLNRYIFEEDANDSITNDSHAELDRLRLLTKDDVSQIYTWDATRLSNNINDFLAIVEEFTAKGICIHFHDINLNTLDKMGRQTATTRTYFQLFRQFAQMGNAQLRSRILTTRKESFRNGACHTPIAPFGYKMENKQLVVDEANRKYVKYIFHSYVDGVSLTDIIKRLTMRNVSSVRGKQWTKISLLKLLSNPTYKGTAVVTFKYRDDNGKVVNTESIVTKCPSIVTSTLWQKAQEKREQNRPRVDRSQKPNALLHGILKCGRCGKNYILFKGLVGKPTYYYTCSDVFRGANTKVNCKNGSVKVENLDSAILLLFKQLSLQHPQFSQFDASLIESARIYTFGKCNKVIQLKLNGGLTYNIMMRCSVNTRYCFLDDTLVNFNPENPDRLFRLDRHTKKGAIFEKHHTKHLDWSEMWSILEELNLVTIK